MTTSTTASVIAASVMTEAEVRALGVTCNLTTAARAFNLGRTTAYKAAANGTFPCRVLKVEGVWIVPTIGLRRALGLEEGAK